MFFAGVDLALVRPTAIAVLGECELVTLAWALGDGDILRVLSLWKPRVVAIDAPLSTPPGGRGLRDVERELRRLGHRLLPPMMGPMRKLTERGMELAKRIESEVIEVHPLTSLRAMGLAKREVAQHFGVESPDLVDAIAAALTAYAYHRGYYTRVGPLVLPIRRFCL